MSAAVNQKIASLQVVRFAAATLVIAHHAWQIIGGGADPPVLAALGPLGVDVFFVLSGYIMAVSASDARAGEFLYRRFTRIVPFYYLLTGAFMLELALAGQFTVGPLLPSFLLVPLDDRPYLSVAWTLDYEMLFYMAFAVVLWLRKPGAALVLAGLALSLAGRQIVGGRVFGFVGNPIILEFLAGIVVARVPASRLGAVAALAGALAMFAALAFLPPVADGWLRPLIMIWPCALTIYGAANVSLGGRMWATLAYLGDASFAAYLVHQFPLSVARPLHAVLPTPLGVLLLVVASWIVAVLTHEAVERPLLKALRRRPAALPEAQAA